jgi:hypothetical protein
MATKFYDVSVISTTIHEDRIRAFYLSDDDKARLNADIHNEDDESSILEITDAQSFCDRNFSEDLSRFETCLVTSMIVGVEEDTKSHEQFLKIQSVISSDAARQTKKALGNLPKTPKSIKDVANLVLEVFQEKKADSGVKFSNDWRMLVVKDVPDYDPAVKDSPQSQRISSLGRS